MTLNVPWEALATRALAHWSLTPQHAELASLSENIVLAVTATDGQRYALRLHRPGYNSDQALASEQTWTQALASAGIGVPEAVRLPDGRFYVTVEMPDGEQRQTGLIRWIDGEPLRERASTEPASFLTKQLGALGALAGRIHNQSCAWAPPAEFTRRRLDAEGLMGSHPHWGPFWALPEMTAPERNLLAATRRTLFDWLMTLDQDPDRFSMIHADLHASNLMLTPGGVTIIDFDDAGFGWHVYELAVALFDADHMEIDADPMDAMVTGYRRERPLSAAQVQQIPAFKLIRCLAVLGWINQRPELEHTNVRPLIDDACQRIQEVNLT